MVYFSSKKHTPLLRVAVRLKRAQELQQEGLLSRHRHQPRAGGFGLAEVKRIRRPHERGAELAEVAGVQQLRVQLHEGRINKQTDK
eukprot:1180961-Prorocentrum_minimum.AAC.2